MSSHWHVMQRMVGYRSFFFKRDPGGLAKAWSIRDEAARWRDSHGGAGAVVECRAEACAPEVPRPRMREDR